MLHVGGAGVQMVHAACIRVKYRTNVHAPVEVELTDSLTYFNENIRRDQPDRIVNMHRKRQKSRKKKENTNIDTFPPSSAIPEDSS